MGKLPNKIVINRKSPANEQDYINAYKQVNKAANRKDGMDIAAVRTLSGETGHVLLKADINRSKDRDHHIGQGYVSDKELRKHMK